VDDVEKAQSRVRQLVMDSESLPHLKVVTVMILVLNIICMDVVGNTSAILGIKKIHNLVSEKGNLFATVNGIFYDHVATLR